MAIFNPEPAAINAPDWTNVTKPIEQPKADTSTGITLDTVGKGIENVVKIADTAVKEDIKDKVDTGVDKLRDATTAQLVAIRNTQIGGQQSMLPDDGAPTPPSGLQSGISRLNTLGVAMAQNGGKANDTLYTGALNAQAKQLRAQYPGYRDYIDEQIKSISGVDPANAYMKNLMEDINKSAENNKTEVNATRTMLRGLVEAGFHDAGGVDAAKVLDGYDKGVISIPQVNTWVNSSKKLEYDTKMKATLRADRQGDDADAASSATKDLSTTTAQTVAHNWTTMTIGKGTDTAEGLFKFIQANAGNEKVQDEKSVAIGQQLVALRNQTFKQMMDQANQGGANSIVAKMGGDTTKVKAVIDGQLATFDTAIQAVFHKDWGAAYSHMKFNEAITSDTVNLLNNAPDETVRRYNRMVPAINQMSPQFGKDFFTTSLLGGVPSKEKEFLKVQKMELLTQPDLPQGKLTSIQGQISAAKIAGVTSPKTYDELIKSVDYLADPNLDTQHKLSLAHGFFDPTQNAGLLSDKNFTMDHYDATLHRNIPGKLSVFTKLTAPQIGESIKELGKSDPTVVPMYQTMLSREFGEQLFSRELKDLTETNQAYTVNSTFKIKFTNDDKSSPHFEAVGIKGEPLTMTEALSRGAPVQAVNRLNTGMAGLYTAYKSSGSADPMNDVMKVIQRYNYEAPTEGKDPYRGDIAPILRGEQGPRGSAIVTAIRESLKAAQRNNLKDQGKN